MEYVCKFLVVLKVIVVRLQILFEIVYSLRGALRVVYLCVGGGCHLSVISK